MKEKLLLALDKIDVDLKNSGSVSATSQNDDLANKELIQTFFAKNSLKSNKGPDENLKDQNTSNYLLMQCEYCGKRYKNYERLKDHIRFCHPKIYHKCDVCSQQFSKKCLLNTHMRKHRKESSCSFTLCNEKFVSNNKLQIHNEKKNIFCNICNVSGFYSKQDLGNHIRTKHTRERVFHCDICNKSFMSSPVYYQHRNVHTNIRKYSCTTCSKTFKRWLTLHNHSKIHTDERPFSCDVCKQTFRQKGDMKKHKRNQHSNITT